MFARFRAWLSSLTEFPPTERGPMPDQDAIGPCTCRPAAFGERHERCEVCGGWVVYLSQHPTDAARREEGA